MNQKSAVSLGPGASSLILIFVVLAMAVLGMLSLMSSRNDLKFSERSADVISAVYRLNEAAEEKRAEIERILTACAAEAGSEDAYLKAIEEAFADHDDIELIEKEITWTESDGVRSLDCALGVLPLTESVRTEWIRHDLMTESEDEWDW